jgi:hypothetical protein
MQATNMSKHHQTKITVTLASGELFTVTSPVTEQSVAQDWEAFQREGNARLLAFLKPSLEAEAKDKPRI